MSQLYIPTVIPKTSMLGEAEWLSDLIRKYPDLDRTKSCRFSRIASAIRREGADVISPARSDFPTIQQAIKDLQELFFLWHVLDPKPGDFALWGKIRNVFGGEIQPSGSDNSNCARNYQFELFARAILERAGLKPEALSERGDFRCELGSWSFAVEAKRFTSLSRVTKGIGEAASQSRDTGLPGILFIDFSEAVNPGDKVLPLKGRIQDFPSVQTARFNAYWSKHGPAIRRAVRKKAILAIVFFDHLVVHEGLRIDTGAGDWRLWTIRDNVRMAPHSQLDTLLHVLDTVGLQSAVER